MPTPKKAPAKRKAESAGGGSTKRQATGGAGGDAGEGGAAVKLKKAKPEALDVAGQLARELGVEEWRVRGAMKLFADGATLPFVARYRKEQTGSMDETQLRSLQTATERVEALESRRAVVLKTLRAAGTLTPKLEAAVNGAATLQLLEDIYLPHRPKRKTKASDARDKGLQPLADLMCSKPSSAFTFPNALYLEPLAAASNIMKMLGGGTPAEALEGARDIVAEEAMEDPDLRAFARRVLSSDAAVTTKPRSKTSDPNNAFTAYHAFSCTVNRLRPYQTLAIARGDKEKVLSFKIQVGFGEKDDAARRVQERVGTAVEKKLSENVQHAPQTIGLWAQQRKTAIADGITRLLLPALEREWWKEAMDRAEQGSLETFATNLRSKLLQPPVKGKAVMAIDPGFKAGCKVAVVNATGEVLASKTVYPLRSAKDASATLSALLQEHACSAIALGNGHGSREAEHFIAAEVKAGRLPDTIRVTIVDEAGASVYSASEIAAKELSTMDVTERGAVSLARRVQDPLSELVKVDPKSLGVGLYQHDINAKHLEKQLRDVVEGAVNAVGVDLNTASPSLLQYIAGLHAGTASKIVAHRDTHGPFPSRASLSKVAGVGPKAFQQAAGFLRVYGSANPLDATSVHPESYKAAKALIKKVSGGAKQGAGLIPEGAQASADTRKEAQELGVGDATLNDILDALRHPDRDPRDTLLGIAPPTFRSGKALARDVGGEGGGAGGRKSGVEPMVGMEMRGTVRNVVEFGAFIDIGMESDGLLHKSKTPPRTTLQNGQVLQVKIEKVEQGAGKGGKTRISLAMAPKSSVVTIDD